MTLTRVPLLFVESTLRMPEGICISASVIALSFLHSFGHCLLRFSRHAAGHLVSAVHAHNTLNSHWKHHHLRAL